MICAGTVPLANSVRIYGTQLKVLLQNIRFCHSQNAAPNKLIHYETATQGVPRFSSIIALQETLLSLFYVQFLFPTFIKTYQIAQ